MKVQEQTTERWHDNRRQDGLTVIEGLDGWVIMPREANPLDRCPCCNRAFTEAIDARFAADFLYLNGIR